MSNSNKKNLRRIHAAKSQLTILTLYFGLPTGHPTCVAGGNHSDSETIQLATPRNLFNYSIQKQQKKLHVFNVSVSTTLIIKGLTPFYPSPFNPKKKGRLVGLKPIPEAVRIWGFHPWSPLRCNESDLYRLSAKAKLRLHSMLLMVNTIMTWKNIHQSDSNGGNLQTQVEIIGTSYSQHHITNDARPIFNHLQPCGWTNSLAPSTLPLNPLHPAKNLQGSWLTWRHRWSLEPQLKNAHPLGKQLVHCSYQSGKKNMEPPPDLWILKIAEIAKKNCSPSRHSEHPNTLHRPEAGRIRMISQRFPDVEKMWSQSMLWKMLWTNSPCPSAFHLQSIQPNAQTSPSLQTWCRTQDVHATSVPWRHRTANLARKWSE